MNHCKAALALLLLLPTMLFAQDDIETKKISELDPINSAQLLSHDDILFGVTVLGSPNVSRRVTLEELRSQAHAIAVDNVAALNNASPIEGQIFLTRGRMTVGDGGGRIYRYEIGSSASPNEPYVVNGPGGIGRYIDLVSESPEITAAGISNDGQVQFTVEDIGTGTRSKLSLAELLIKTGVGGVSDHGGLAGLADDDHPHYLNNARGDARYYTQSQLDVALANKSDDGHGHAIADTTGLQAALDAKLAKASNLSDLANVATARTNLGLVIGTDVHAHMPAASVLEMQTGTEPGLRAMSPLRVAQAIAALAGESGTPDHGILTGLADDDHPQYHNDARGDARYFTQAQVTASLATKSNTGHGHVISDVTGLADQLAAKLAASQNLADLANVTTARTNLGLVIGTDVHAFMPSASQVEMEAGTETALRAMTPQRVAQAIAALGDVQQAIVVDNVAGMAALTPADGDIVITRGQTTKGDGGARFYRYDSASAVALASPYVVDGPSSVGRYLELTNERDPLVSTDIVDDADIRFPVENADDNTQRTLTLAELKASQNIRVVADVAAMKAVTDAKQGQVFQTLAYDDANPGVGANLYRYTTGSGTDDAGFFLTATGMGAGGFEAVDQSVYDIRQWGGVENGETGTADHTAIIQAMIDHAGAQYRQNARIYIPRGYWHISSTLNFGTLRGFTFYGDASETIMSATATYKSGGTRLIWHGDDGGTMIRVDGAYFLFKDLGIFGSDLPNGTFAPTANRAGIGILLGFTSGIGSGNAVVDNVRITDCEIGWQNGVNLADGNCGDMVFRSMHFRFCGVGMKTVNLQGLNYHFDYLQSQVNEKLFQFDAGGGLFVGFVHTLETPIMLEIGGNDAGSEVGTFIFNFVKPDADQGGSTPRLLHMPVNNTAGVQVIFRSVRMPAAAYLDGGSPINDGLPVFRITGGTRLLVQDMTFLDDAGVIVEMETTTAAFYPQAVFERCMIDAAGGSVPATWTDTPAFVKVIDTANAKTVTADNATDTFTSTSHGFFNGDRVRVSSTVSLPSGISADTTYFVVAKTTNTFQLSETEAGSAATFTTDGSGTIKVFHVSPDSNVADWVFRDCRTNGLNLQMPTIGRTKRTIDPTNTVVNMRFKERLILDYASSGQVVFATQRYDGEEIEIFANGNTTISNGTGSNRFRLNGGTSWAGDADGATFTFRRKGGEWLEKSRAVY
jgi:hypothetical protein